MALLSSPRLEAVHLIREQLRCTLCDNIFQEPQCLDCKHNFCLPCILQHLKQNKSHCPTCQLPTRPSEVTRNQFLESILLAWHGVETELKALEGDPSLHATTISVADTDKALHRVATGGTLPSKPERPQTRGPVANHKWHIDTQEIRQALHLEQPYLPQQYGSCHNKTAQWKKTSSSDLPNDYGASASRTRRYKERATQQDTAIVHEDKTSESDEDVKVETEEERETRSFNSVMATQDVESYLARIRKQREALSQWEREHQRDPLTSSLLVDLERSLQNNNSFDELLRERQVAQRHEKDRDLTTQRTQMPQLPRVTSALESPDLLATYRQRRQRYENDRVVAKRRLRLAIPSRKRLWMPTLRDASYRSYDTKAETVSGRAYGSNIESKSEVGKEDLDEVPNCQPATVLSDEYHESSSDGIDSADKENREDEYEMKPAPPLRSIPENRLSRAQLYDSGRPSVRHEKAQSVLTAFQSNERAQSESFTSQAPKHLTSSPKAGNDKTTKVLSGTCQPSFANPVDPPVPTLIGKERSLAASEHSMNFVFVSSDLAREEVKRVLEATQRLGGKFGHDFDLKRDPVTNRFCTSVTHLITKAVPPIEATRGQEPHELRCKRTAKYMRALAEGTFVMDLSWVSASLAAGRWLTEDPFEMIGDIYSDATGKPHEGHVRRVQTGRRNSIFSLFCFVLLVPENEFDFQFASVRTLVNNFGGTIVHAITSGDVPLHYHSRRTRVGVVSKTTLPFDAKAKWQQFHIPIVRITWIFDSVSHLEVLPFDDYYPY